MNRRHIVVDLEATCFAQENDRDLAEIIEIGACLANETGEVISEFQCFVKPVVNPILSDFCIGLTHITQAQVDSAPEYEAAIKLFNSWVCQCQSLEDGEVVAWSSWGEYDRKQFERNSKLIEVENPHLLTIPHMNLKNVYGKQVGRGKKMVGLSKALACEKMVFEGTHHRGIDDAKNTARLLPVSLGLIPSKWTPTPVRSGPFR